jgi:hypothetical protein
MRIRAAAIRELEDDRGRVTPESVVNAAEAPTHALHNDFVWDDAAAAHQHRLNTARQIISSVRVVVTTSTKRVACVAYVRDPLAAPREAGYVSVSRLRTEADAAKEALSAEIARVQSTLERAKEIAAGLDLEADFHDALEGAVGMTARMRRGLAPPEPETAQPSVN